METHMKARCERPTVPFYYLYGGRGIRVCERWQKFENFLEDMGRRPPNKTSLDRIDPNGNYEPGNCRWATQQEQCDNMRHTIKIEYNNETITLRELGIKTGFKKDKLARLHRRGELKDFLSSIRKSNEGYRDRGFLP